MEEEGIRAMLEPTLRTSKIRWRGVKRETNGKQLAE
jgi:hypothetical protein